MPPWVSEIKPTQITFDHIHMAIGLLVFFVVTGYMMWNIEINKHQVDKDDYYAGLFFSVPMGFIAGVLWPVILIISLMVFPIWLTVSKFAKRHQGEPHGPH